MSLNRLLAFDLDGTLTDSVPDIAAAVNRTLASRSLRPLDDAAVTSMVGDGVMPLIERAFAAVGGTPDKDAAAYYLADYEANVSGGTRLFPGIEAALEKLRYEGWTFAVCTNKPERPARLLLAALGIADRFAAVGGGDTFSVQKPNPEHLLGTIAAAGGTVSRTLMVGDHHNDVRAALGCGVKAIFAAWGYGRAGMDQGASAVAATAADLPAIAARLMQA